MLAFTAWRLVPSACSLRLQSFPLNQRCIPNCTLISGKLLEHRIVWMLSGRFEVVKLGLLLDGRDRVAMRTPFDEECLSCGPQVEDLALSVED